MSGDWTKRAQLEADSDIELKDRVQGDQTVIASWLIFVLAAVRESGIDSDALLEEVGLDPAIINDPDARIPSEKLDSVYIRATEVTGNRAFGLSVAKHATPLALHALGYSLFASSTLLAFFERLARFFRMISLAGAFTIEETPEGYCVAVDTVGPVADPRGDAFWATIVRFARMVSHEGFSPSGVTLLSKAPDADTAELFREFFACPVRFDGCQLRMSISHDEMHKRLPGANAELVRKK